MKLPVEITYTKCQNDTCNEQIRRTPSDLKNGIGQFCCNKCRYSQRLILRKYKDADIKWIMENTHIIPRWEMAKKYNVTLTSFNKMVSVWRKRGHKIQKIPKRGNHLSILTDTQRKWINDNFEDLNYKAMEDQLNVPHKIIRNYVKYALGSKTITRTKPSPNLTTNRNSYMIKITKDGQPDKRAQKSGDNGKKHNKRKPALPTAPIKPMDRRLPNRVIDEKGCIPVIFNDKNHTKFMARDKEHAAAIRVKYAYLEKPLVARLG